MKKATKIVSGLSNSPKHTPKLIRRNSRGRTPEGDPNPIDIHVGKRINERRILLGLSQEKLAALLGITFQQVQKYERGTNRIGASRLWDISQLLDVPTDYFYLDMPSDILGRSPRMFTMNINTVAEEPLRDYAARDPMDSSEAVKLVNAYYKISNRRLAKSLFESIINAYHPDKTLDEPEKEQDH